MTAIEITGLVKGYGGRPVLRGLEMNVPAGAVYGFLGVNGAGKTTTLGVVTGFLPPGRGTVTVRGTLSSQPQDALLYPDRPLRRQLKLLARLGGIRGREAGREADRVLGLVGLADSAGRPPKKLSHGMRRRAAVAQALLGDPDVLVLDEPTAGLDPKSAAELRRLIARRGEGKTVVVSSHLLGEVEEICSHVGVIHDGRMVFEGTMAALTGSGSSVRFQLDREVEPDPFRCLPAVRSAELEEESLVLTLSFAEEEATLEEINGRAFDLLRRLGAGVRRITPGRRLEDEFLRLLR
ncbi:MAG: ABC transporter ATP-binding protein [Candidatus Erginobacter occultus]|nr:ABC transporter ATP-binding protein [Candidatus Erginobacter occultus]